MLDYLIVGGQMSLVGLAVLACLRTAPARWRYRFALAAFAMSVAPWPFLPVLTISASTNAVLTETLPLMAPVPSASVATFGPSSLPGGSVFLWAMLVSLVAGVAAYSAMAWRQSTRLRWWRSVSRSGDHLIAEAAKEDRIGSAASRCEIRILPDSDVAVTTPSRAVFGVPVRASTVWLGDRLVEDLRLGSVLTHELVHVRRRDPQAEMLLTMCRCLLWWHPLAWLWSRVGRREMELSCDEECASLLGRRAYRETLATLIRDLSGATGVAMISRGSFNLRRARNLMKAKTANKRHWLAATAAAVIMPALGIELAANPPAANSYARFLSDGVRLVDDERGQRIEIRFDMPGLEAIRHLAQTDGRRFHIHADATFGHAELDASGTRNEVVEAVAVHLGLATRFERDRVLIAPADQLDDAGWRRSAIMLPPLPDGRQTRLDIELRIDGQNVPAPTGLLLNESDWTSFETRGHRFNLMPEEIGDDGVDLALAVDPSEQPVIHSFRRLRYAEQRSWNVGYHDPRGRPRSISLRLTARPISAHGPRHEEE